MKKLIFVLALALASIFSHKAVAIDLFTVEGVEVKGGGTTAKEAKDAALIAGEQQAFQMLMKRVIPESSHSQIPTVDDTKIADYVQSFEVVEEKITSKHYQATISFSFNPVFVNKLLEEHSLNHIVKKSDTILVIPVTIKGDQVYLWEKDNIWLEIWSEISQKSPYMNFVLPLGDSSDISMIELDKLLADNYQPDDSGKMEALATKYQAKKIILSEAKIIDGSDPKKPELKISLVYTDDLSKERRYKTVSDYDTDVKTALKESLAKIITGLEINWRDKQFTSSTNKMKITVTVPINGLKEWSELNNTIRGFDFIDKIDVQALNIKYAVIDLHFTDSYENIVKLLGREGFSMENQGDSLIMKRYSADADSDPQVPVVEEYIKDEEYIYEY